MLTIYLILNIAEENLKFGDNFEYIFNTSIRLFLIDLYTVPLKKQIKIKCLTHSLNYEQKLYKRFRW